jgi:hypothetical protein
VRESTVVSTSKPSCTTLTRGATGCGAVVTAGPEDADVAYSIVITPDDSKVFVTGYAGTVHDGENYFTVGYKTATGQAAWSKMYNGPGDANDRASSISISPDGSKVFVTGASRGSTGNDDYATVAYGVATGGLLWARRDNPANRTDAAGAVLVSRDGSKVFVTGQTDASSARGFDLLTFAYRSS